MRSALPLATLVVCALIRPTPAVAQETPTERTAAADVIRRVNDLERSLALPQLVARLTGKDPRRDAVVARARELMERELLAMADDITRHPETGWKEERSVKILTDYLTAHGFDVEPGVAGLKTAFVARDRRGTPGPNLGVILEYDALRGTTRDFHGDQHSAQGPVGMAAAVAVAEFLSSSKTAGTVTVYGTPAEEVGAPEAKTTMYEGGVFKGADVLVRSHSSTGTERSAAGFGRAGCAAGSDRAVQPHRRPAQERTAGSAHSGHHHRGRQGPERRARSRRRGSLDPLPRPGLSGPAPGSGQRRGAWRSPRHRHQGAHRRRLGRAGRHLGRGSERPGLRVPEAAGRDESRGGAGAPGPLRGDGNRGDPDPRRGRHVSQLERRLPYVRDGGGCAGRGRTPRLPGRRPGDGGGAVPLRHRRPVPRDRQAGIRRAEGTVRRVSRGSQGSVPAAQRPRADGELSDGSLAHPARGRDPHDRRLPCPSHRAAAHGHPSAGPDVHLRSGAPPHHRERRPERDGRPRHEPRGRARRGERADRLAPRDRLVAAAVPRLREAARRRRHHADPPRQYPRDSLASRRDHARRAGPGAARTRRRGRQERNARRARARRSDQCDPERRPRARDETPSPHPRYQAW